MTIVLSIDPAQPIAVYRDALVAAGAREDEVRVVVPGDELPAGFDGLLVSGGADVEPARYGETKLNETVQPKSERDALDFALVARALETGAALFGICRGLQVLNVALGGTLWQDLPVQREGGLAHSFSSRDGHDPAYLAHVVHAARGVRGDLPLAAELAAASGLPVNSRHHQAVKDLAPGLVPLATAPDGLVEAFARSGGAFLAAVQWHPENLVARSDQRSLFVSFLEAARRRASGAAHRELPAPKAARPAGAAAPGGGNENAPGSPDAFARRTRPDSGTPEPE